MNIEWWINDAKPFDAGFYKCSVHYVEHKQYLVMDGEQYVGGK